MNMLFDKLYRKVIEEELSDGTKEYFNRPWDTMGVIVSLDFKIEGHDRNATIYNPWDIMIDGKPETRSLENTGYDLLEEQWYSIMWEQGYVCKDFQQGLTDITAWYKNTRIPEELYRYGRSSLKRNSTDLKEIRAFLKELNEYITQFNYSEVVWKFCEYGDDFYGLFVQVPQRELVKQSYRYHELKDLIDL